MGFESSAPTLAADSESHPPPSAGRISPPQPQTLATDCGSAWLGGIATGPITRQGSALQLGPQGRPLPFLICITENCLVGDIFERSFPRHHVCHFHCEANNQSVSGFGTAKFGSVVGLIPDGSGAISVFRT
jgi:hypothetical protein